MVPPTELTSFGFNPPAPFFWLMVIFINNMKYIITESRLDKAVIKYLNMEYGDLKKFIRPDNERSVYYIKNRKIYMEHEVQPGELDIDASIWTDLQNIFSLKDSEIQRIITRWAESFWGLKGVKPVSHEF